MSAALVKATGALQPLPDVSETSGAGLETLVAGQRLRLGSPLFCEASDEQVEAALQSNPGASLLAIRFGRKPARLLAFRQRLRPDARAVVAVPKLRGISLSAPASRMADIRSGSKNICSVRQRPIPLAPNFRAYIASSGLSALVRTPIVCCRSIIFISFL